MLQRLRIENLLLFSDSEVIFSKGLNVISGETGAGKSVFLQALGLVLGAKADKSLIRPGLEEAYVEAFFDQKIPLFLELTDEDPVLARRISKGSSRAFVSGRSCSAEILREGASQLIFLSSQHAAQKLSSASYQRDLLDAFALIKTSQLREKYALWQDCEEQLQEMRKKLLSLEERREFLQHEKELIEELAPEEEEEDDLLEERKRLLHADKLEEKMHFIRSLLLGDEQDSLLVLLHQSRQAAEEMAEHDSGISELQGLLEEAGLSLEAAADLLRSSEGDYAANPARLEEIESRLFALSDLRRRYKNMTIREIKLHLEEISQELVFLEDGEAELQSLEDREKAAQKEYFALAKKISQKRKKAARDLEDRVGQELSDLALSGARLIIKLTEATPGPYGLEKVEMLLSANKGIEATALGKGASGGELSRLHLALLLSLPGREGLSYVFDEIDAGIGGQTAHALAEKLAQLSKKNQVIVVTHLAQIAALADNHLAIEKRGSATATEAVINTLNQEGRQEEIARLLGLQKEDASQASKLLAAARKK